MSIEIPWGVALKLYRHHLIQALNKEHRMSFKEAKSFIDEHIGKHNQILDDLLVEIDSKHQKQTEDHIDDVFKQRIANKH